MEAQVQTHNSTSGVCGGQSDTMANFLSEQLGINDFKISPIRTSYNWPICDYSTRGLILLHPKQERII
jgi:hypothetical protein